jgi:hypothetical protein
MRSFLTVCVLTGALFLAGPAGAETRGTTTTPLSVHRTQPIRTPDVLAHAKAEARQVTVQFFGALDRGQYAHACALLAHQFYVRHHIPDRDHCVAGFKVGMGGWAVKFRITAVSAQPNAAVVHCVVDGSPGSVQLIREAVGFRIAGMHAD